MTTLSEFLRARREQLRPADVGLPDNGRRRTPGLRREEVATLAGVSIDYLVRLEQGRDTRRSPSVIAALANALHLDRDERRLFSKLALINQAGDLCPEAQPLPSDVPSTVRMLLDQLNPTAAIVVGPTSDVLAWNDAWERLVAPLGMLDRSMPNLAHYVFLHPTAREVLSNWVVAADEQVSRLRAAEQCWGSDPGYQALLDELRSSPEFIEHWATFAAPRARRITRLVHPDLGALRLHDEPLLLADDDDQRRLIAWLPADEITAAALASAHAHSVAARRTGQLRAIS